MTNDEDIDEGIRRMRLKLATAIESDHAHTFAFLVEALGRWCHEGCTVGSVDAGVCSHMVEHAGSVEDALVALKIVAASVIIDIDNGSEGC